MSTPIFSIQYLEDSPHLAQISPQAAAGRLRAAFDRLPLTMVLIGWRLPEATLDACAQVCRDAGAALYRWHPLLTSDGTFMPRPEWQVIGLDDTPVPGFRHMPEFTFVCPNRPDAAEAVLDNLAQAAADPRYDGVFLDRIRWPSPAPDPERHLGCFCPDCHLAAAERGLDLRAPRQRLLERLASGAGPQQMARLLLDPDDARSEDPASERAFLQHRAQSITEFVAQASRVVRERGLAVGLDAFSPALAPLVGQNLAALHRSGDWIKIMSYGHTLGPAGMPFELGELADWLVERGKLSDGAALRLLAEATHLPLPEDHAALRRGGLTPAALGAEASRARKSGVRTLLAGVELVDIAGVTSLHEAQIRADLIALRDAGADGLALSWDLWEMPLERLDVVRDVWNG